MKRRHVLAGAAALPFAAIGVDVAVSDSYASDAADDPAVRAFRVWSEASAAHLAWFDGREDWADDDPEETRLHDAEWAARKALAETVATTPAGVACQLRLALDIFGEHQPGADRNDPEGYAFYAWADELDGKLIRNMLAGAERLSGKAVS